MKTIEIPDGYNAEWQTIDGKQMLVLVEEKPKCVTDRIKTFEDAVKELGEDNHLCVCYNKVRDCGEPSIVAYAKLCIIIAALNEGWKPQFTKDEYRYFSWFYVYTQEEIDKMDEENKKELLLWGGNAYNGSIGGLVCSYSDDSFSYSYSSIGARLALKTSELARYCGKQFISIWADYLFIAKK